MLFDKNHCYHDIHKYRVSRIKDEFDNITFIDNSEILSIYKYLEKSPERFYCINSFNLYFELLQNSKVEKEKDLISILRDIESQLDISIKNLKETNNKNVNDFILPSDNITLLTFIDHDIHYNYLKILESSFYSFLLIPAKLSRIKRNKSTDGLDLFNVIEELSNSDFSFINEVYNNTIRNGIAHGKVKYTDWDIIYEDKKGNKEQISIKDIVKKFDNLLNIVNGFCLAFSIFCFTNLKFFIKNLIRIPNSILIEELQEKVNTPGWKVIECLDSVAMKNKEQLIVYVRNDNWDYQKVFFYTFQTAYWIERLTKSYDRIFFHIESKHSLLGWAGFDAKKLRELREQNSENIEDYKEVLENNLVFFNPKIKFPRIIYKLGSLRAIFKVIMPFQIHDAINKVVPKRFTIRDTQIHSQSGYLVINDPCVVIKKDFVDQAVEIIRTDYRSIAKKTIKYSRKKFRSWKRYQAVKFIRICIFDKDERVRNLRNSGLNENLIATIGFNLSPTINTIDIIGGVLEKKGKYRIVWNSKWRGFSNVKNT